MTPYPRNVARGGATSRCCRTNATPRLFGQRRRTHHNRAPVARLHMLGGRRGTERQRARPSRCEAAPPSSNHRKVGRGGSLKRLGTASAISVANSRPLVCEVTLERGPAAIISARSPHGHAASRRLCVHDVGSITSREPHVSLRCTCASRARVPRPPTALGRGLQRIAPRRCRR
jgi:hypothetical protein